MGASCSFSVARARYSQSEAVSAPVRNAWLSMPASAERMRLVSCSFVISRLKMATGMCCFMATRPLIFCRLVRVSTMLEERGVRALESRPERIS